MSTPTETAELVERYVCARIDVELAYQAGPLDSRELDRLTTTASAARTCTFCGTPHASRERCPIDEYEQGACTCGHPDCGAC